MHTPTTNRHLGSSVWCQGRSVWMDWSLVPSYYLLIKLNYSLFARKLQETPLTVHLLSKMSLWMQVLDHEATLQLFPLNFPSSHTTNICFLQAKNTHWQPCQQAACPLNISIMFMCMCCVVYWDKLSSGPSHSHSDSDRHAHMLTFIYWHLNRVDLWVSAKDWDPWRKSQNGN